MSRPALALLTVALAACGRQRMDIQPKYSPDEASTRFPHAQSALQHVTGTVPISAADDKAPPRTLALLARGRDRYAIYCTPCHGAYGDGDGRVVVQFGFPRPAPFDDERLRAAPDSHLLDVLTNGYGAMYPYATVLPPQDRWAVIGYVRALQLARHADVARFPQLRAQIPEPAP